jgi:hypothetical protein
VGFEVFKGYPGLSEALEGAMRPEMEFSNCIFCFLVFFVRIFNPENSSVFFNPNSLWQVHMGIWLKERQITEEPKKVKIGKK